MKALVFLLAILFSGCSPTRYLLQAGRGQMELSNKAQPIADVLLNPRVSPSVKALLKEVSSIKEFGKTQGLKPTSNYTQYVDLKRESVVWLVSACDSLRFRPKQWSFPILGSFPYLGWFDPDDAKRYAEDLEKEEGLDVDVHGAQAYSTLGWFQDPIVSTMLSEGPEALGSLVNVILHESVHATLFIKDQAYFNESLASFMADTMTLEYLTEKKGDHSKERLSYTHLEKRRSEVSIGLNQTYQKLKALYQSDRSKSEKLKEKDKILTEVQKSLRLLQRPNNATLIQYRAYHSHPECLVNLFKCSDSNWPLFLSHIKSLTPDRFSKPNQIQFEPVLHPILHEVCPEDLH